MTDKSLSKKRALAGRKGGLKGGTVKTRKGLAVLSPEERQRISRKGVEARLAKAERDGIDDYEDMDGKKV